MFGLLCFPNFAEALVSTFVLANLSDLRVKVFESVPLRVRRHFDGPLLRNQRDLVIVIFIGRSIEYGTNPVADSHVVSSPIRIEQNAVAVLRNAIGERNEKNFAVVAKHLLDLPFNGDSAFEFELRFFSFSDFRGFPVTDGRPESVFMIIASVTCKLLVLIGERAWSSGAQINRIVAKIDNDLVEDAGNLQTGRILARRDVVALDRFIDAFESANLIGHVAGKFFERF